MMVYHTTGQTLIRGYRQLSLGYDSGYLISLGIIADDTTVVLA